MQECKVCKTTDVKLYSTFGKLKCQKCIDNSRTGRTGHSGMIYDKEAVAPTILSKELTLIPCKKSDPYYVKVFIEHYPKSKGIVGRQLNYIIYNNGQAIGIIGFASPPLNYKVFVNYFNTENPKLYLNNNVFCIRETEKNLGTKVLKIARNIINKDYLNKYGDKLLGLVTFVELPRTGALYKADNWTYLGLTKGFSARRRGVDWLEKTFEKGAIKHIFGYKYK